MMFYWQHSYNLANKFRGLDIPLKCPDPYLQSHFYAIVIYPYKFTFTWRSIIQSLLTSLTEIRILENYIKTSKYLSFTKILQLR